MRLVRAVSLTPEEIRRRTKRLVRDLLLGASVVELLFVSLAAYAGMWPPVLVVESGSMQHSDTTSELGVLDTGDLAVIQAVHSPAEIVTYLQGRAQSYTSFGDYGDVIAFADPEPNESAVLIHRVFAYVTRNASGGFDVPALAGIPRPEWWGVATNGSNATTASGLRSFKLTGMGWRHDLTMEWKLTALSANYSNNGFLTFGDHNLYSSSKRTDPWILPVSYVLARARAEIPWLGLLRLTFSPSPEGCCAGWGSTDPDVGAPANSWLDLEVVLVIAFGGPVLADFALPRFVLPWLRQLRTKMVDKPSERNLSDPTSSHPAIVQADAPASSLATLDFTDWLRVVDARIQRIRSLQVPSEDSGKHT